MKESGAHIQSLALLDLAGVSMGRRHRSHSLKKNQKNPQYDLKKKRSEFQTVKQSDDLLTANNTHENG